MPKSVVGAMLVGLAFVLVSVGAETRRSKAEAMTPRELWSLIKASLMAPDGEEYFENSFKGAMVPGGAEGVTMFIGTLLSAEPEAQPSVLVVAISDRTTPEVTLRLKDSDYKDTHLNGPLMPGSLIQFEGVADSFTQDPFMVTFGVFITKRGQTL